MPRTWFDSGLNPCCNGITERHIKHERIIKRIVLILVVMELLRDLLLHIYFRYLHCLNPCCNGITERQKFLL